MARLGRVLCSVTTGRRSWGRAGSLRSDRRAPAQRQYTGDATVSIPSCRDRNIRNYVPFQGSLRTAQHSLLLTQRNAAEEGMLVDANVSLLTLKLKERIVKHLENRYRKMGTNEAISWRGIWIESGTSEEDFRRALSAAAETEIVFADPDHVKLRSHLRLKKDLVPADILSSSMPSSEQLYGRALNLVRLFLQFRKKQPVNG